MREDGDDLPVVDIDGAPFLVQEFEIPEGTIPVRMQVGDAPVTIIGWVVPGDGNIPALLRNVAHEVEEIEKGRAD